ncbi:hypothetical protein D9M71_676390 [compost metagenome]
MAGIAIVVHALVAVAGTKKDDAAFALAALGRGVLYGQAGTRGQRKLLRVSHVGRVSPMSFRRPPTAGNDIGPLVRGPEKRVCFGPGA